MTVEPSTSPPQPNWRLDVLVMGRPSQVVSVAQQLQAALEQVPGALVKKQGFRGLKVVPLRLPAEGFKEGVWLPPTLFTCEVSPVVVSTKGYFDKEETDATYTTSDPPGLDWVPQVVNEHDVVVHALWRWDTSNLAHPPWRPPVCHHRFNPSSFPVRTTVVNFDADDLRRHFGGQAAWDKDWKATHNRERFMTHETAVNALAQQAWLRQFELEECFDPPAQVRRPSPRL